MSLAWRLRFGDRNVAEALLNIARCKLRGGDQRVAIVYDDRTLSILGIRSIGISKGQLRVNAKLPGKPVIGARLAHKADQFDMVDLASERLFLVQDEMGAVGLPDGLAISVEWT